ncbi:hypothetical protein [Bradyrhizobium sp. 1]|uniref:hypothetical protein n=1 Tax=Bradyrhizobium sp. 1 TaxID=241591 RepID=UPI001FF8E482|nr:hypothetical protein [Bradyrhizobium sp. 1]MCK1390648.1 hypothetical protein [Bradyrhizobium sp. 1]
MKKRQKKSKNITAAQKQEFWEEHLPYEIDMMRATFAIAITGSPSQAVHNAMVESFLLHCRNIIEFFKYNPPCDFSPTFFTDGTFKLNKTFVNAKLYDKINQQISHLTAERTKLNKGKLGPSEWKILKDQIEGEIARMEKSLTLSARNSWKYNRPVTINSGSGTGASSQISSTGTP